MIYLSSGGCDGSPGGFKCSSGGCEDVFGGFPIVHLNSNQVVGPWLLGCKGVKAPYHRFQNNATKHVH